VLKFLLKTNLYIAFAALVFLLANALMLNLHLQDLVLLSVHVFSSTWFIYQFSRWMYFKSADYASDDDTLDWFVQYPRINHFTLILSALVSVLCLPFLKFQTFLMLSIIGLLSLLYPIPILFPFGISTKFRDFPFIKVFLIATVWSIAMVVLPALESGIAIFERIDILVLFVLQFIFLLFICLPFDIHDRDLDSKKLVKTIPVVFGVEASKKMVLVLGIIYSIGISLWYLFFSIIEMMSLVSIIMLVLSLLWVVLYRLDHLNKNQLSLIFDGSMLIYFGCILLNYLLGV
jgi:hypothetical protein